MNPSLIPAYPGAGTALIKADRDAETVLRQIGVLSRRHTEELATGDEASTSLTRAAEISAEPEEIVIKEIPPEAAETFEAAINTYNIYSPDSMKWIPLDENAINADEPTVPFVRGDAVVKSTKEKLDNIWCAMVEMKIGPMSALMLVLVRDNIAEDVEDHILLVRCGHPSGSRDNLERYCKSFANSGLPTTGNRDIVGMIGSQRASRLTTILRTLSMVDSELFMDCY